MRKVLYLKAFIFSRIAACEYSQLPYFIAVVSALCCKSVLQWFSSSVSFSNNFWSLEVYYISSRHFLRVVVCILCFSKTDLLFPFLLELHAAGVQAILSGDCDGDFCLCSMVFTGAALLLSGLVCCFEFCLMFYQL